MLVRLFGLRTGAIGRLFLWQESHSQWETSRAHLRSIRICPSPDFASPTPPPVSTLTPPPVSTLTLDKEEQPNDKPETLRTAREISPQDHATSWHPSLPPQGT